MKRLALLVVGLLVVGDASAALAQEPSSPGEGSDGVERVLMVSLPGLTWEEVRDHDLPAIEGVLQESGVANLSPRAVASRATPGAAYLTISAGTRATSRAAVDGQQLGVRETISGAPAGEIFGRRSGTTAAEGHVALSWPALVSANADRPFDAELGLLAETLDEAGLGVVAIGNADGSDTIAPSHERQVGLAAALSDGRVPAAELGSDLLTEDRTSAFGQRLDRDVVVDRFQEAWEAPAGRDGGVVLVEASDLARTMRYRSRVDGARYGELRTQALADSDELVGQLLEEVDPERDAVMLLAPYNLPGDRDLTVAALRTPDHAPGYLRSASTQRARFVTLVDVAPTVLDLVDVTRPAAMEGRPFEQVSSSATLGARVDELVSGNDVSRFRERLLFPTTLALIVSLTLVTAAATMAIVRGSSAGTRRLVTAGALATLAGLPLSYVARGFPLERLGIGFYWAFVVVGALVAGWAGTALAARLRRPRAGLLLILGAVLGVLSADALAGSPLSLGAAFGYSAAGNARLYGVSNYSFGQIAAATFLVAGLVAASHKRRWSRPALFAFLGAMLLVVGIPVWGANVGGSLALTPTIILFALLLLGRRVRLRSVALAGLVTLGAVITFGLLDLARPAGERAHLGRLFERVNEEGFGPLLSIVERKFVASVQVFGSSFWVAAIPIAVAFLVFLALYPTRPLARLRAQIPTLGTGLIAAGVAATLGTLTNDSGPIVAGVALLVLTASLVSLALEPAVSPPALSEATTERAQAAPAPPHPPDGNGDGAAPATVGSGPSVSGSSEG